MIADLRNTFRVSFIMSDAPMPIASASLEFGKQEPSLEWVRIDGFPRETLWEGRAQREAWERANPRSG